MIFGDILEVAGVAMGIIVGIDACDSGLTIEYTKNFPSELKIYI